MSRQIALIASGNAFFKDEGMGLYAGKFLKENYDFEPEVDIVDGGTLGFGLMALLQEYETLFIVNTGSLEGRAAGEIVVHSAEAYMDQKGAKKTANEVEIAEMLQICSLTERMAETTLISVIPEDVVSVDVALTATMQAVWPHYIETILEQLHANGITASPKPAQHSLAEIIAIFASPSVAQQRGF